MRSADVFFQDQLIGELVEEENGKFSFRYKEGYSGPAVSLTMPISQKTYAFENFPPFFDGLLPEGAQLEALLRSEKLDRHDSFGQLMVVGGDLVGAVTVKRST